MVEAMLKSYAKLLLWEGTDDAELACSTLRVSGEHQEVLAQTSLPRCGGPSIVMGCCKANPGPSLSVAQRRVLRLQRNNDMCVVQCQVMRTCHSLHCRNSSPRR